MIPDPDDIEPGAEDFYGRIDALSPELKARADREWEML